jgi:hypothetical protein
MRSTKEVIPALVMIGFSLTTVLGVRELSYWSGFAPGPAFAPYWVAGAGAFLALVLLVQAKLSPSGQKPDWPDRFGGVRVLLTTAGLWMIVALSPYLGFIPSAVIFMLFLLLGILRKRLAPSLITVLITTALLYGVFVWWLKVALPTGPLGI